ncbi:MAG: sporulation protein [Sphingomonas sp.]|uniref:SPOR domain-containing protein n=1 Tax=Sphingomonas sp. TaxID=28214 RepID=UPI001222DDF9|nr:SPOR domain-containing protein [Sphingomonas sp.]THD36782.1 MAG: sporulation protein [Sphingomonas sp.]
MRTLIGAAALSLMVIAGVPALADTKAGVDAWNRGDYTTAVAEWRKAAIAGDADAQFNLAQAYKLGRGVPVDLPMAESWYRKAALQGHPQAEDNYGLALFQDGKRDEAVPWLEKAVARGEPRAQLVLGTMLFNGDSVPRDWVRAYALLQRSSQAGLPQGSQTLAEMDKYIPDDQRQAGIAMARQMEAQVGRPNYSGEVAGGSDAPPRPAIATIDVPPSRPGATYPQPGAKPPKGKPPVVVVAPATRPVPRPVVAPPSPPQPAPPKVVVKPAPKPVPVATGGGWRVQLGAFGDPSNAHKLWSQVAGRFPGRQPSFVKAGALTRLLVGPYASKGEAAGACGAVKPCVPVAS